MEVTDLLTRHDAVYSKFRTLNVEDQKEEFTPEQLQNFRDILFLMICHNESCVPYTKDIELTQMCAEYFYSTIQQRGVNMYFRDFLVTGELDQKDTFWNSYALFNHILQDRSKVNLCFLLPYLGLYDTKYYELTKYDIPRLERYAFTFWDYIRRVPTEKVDLVYDFIEVSEILRFIINLTFSDKSSRSEYVIDRTFTLLKEIAVCWACAVLNRSKLASDQENKIVSATFTHRIHLYKKIAAKRIKH